MFYFQRLEFLGDVVLEIRIFGCFCGKVRRYEFRCRPHGSTCTGTQIRVSWDADPAFWFFVFLRQRVKTRIRKPDTRILFTQNTDSNDRHTDPSFWILGVFAAKSGDTNSYATHTDPGSQVDEFVFLETRIRPSDFFGFFGQRVGTRIRNHDTRILFTANTDFNDRHTDPTFWISGCFCSKDRIRLTGV
jgi:hypothetical protein